MWCLPFLLGVALAGEPPSWDLLVLQGPTLSRVHGDAQETVAVLDFLRPSLTRASEMAVEASLDGTSALYVWGRFGLGWVNLATRRPALLTDPTRTVRGARAAGAWMVFHSVSHASELMGTPDGQIRMWSNTLGKEFILCATGCLDFATSPSGAVVWLDISGVRMASPADLEARAAGQQAAVKTLFAGPLNPDMHVSVSPDGQRILFLHGPSGSPEFALSGDTVVETPASMAASTIPLSAMWFDAAGAPVGSDLLESGYDSVVVDAYWDDQGRAHAMLTSCNDCDDSVRDYILDGTKVTLFEPTRAPAPRGTLPPGVSLEARMVQGHAELFATDATRTWQVSDLTPLKPKMGADDQDEFSPADAIGWVPWTDGRHALVGAIWTWRLYEPMWGTRAHLFVVDLASSIPTQVDLGEILWAEGDGEKPPASGEAATAAIDWGNLGTTAPDGSATFTESGKLLFADGHVAPLSLPHQWAGWLPAPQAPSGPTAPTP